MTSLIRPATRGLTLDASGAAAAGTADHALLVHAAVVHERTLLGRRRDLHTTPPQPRAQSVSAAHSHGTGSRPASLTSCISSAAAVSS